MRDALPMASFIGFTGTPIESGDRNTQAVFGDLGGVPNTCEFDSLRLDVRSRELQSQARHELVSQVYLPRFARRGH